MDTMDGGSSATGPESSGLWGQKPRVKAQAGLCLMRPLGPQMHLLTVSPHGGRTGLRGFFMKTLVPSPSHHGSTVMTSSSQVSSLAATTLRAGGWVYRAAGTHYPLTVQRPEVRNQPL